MRTIRPIALISFLFFISVLAEKPQSADDLTSSYETNNDYEISDLDDAADAANAADADDDYTSDYNEDIIYTNMISKKPPSAPPATPSRLTSPSLIKVPSPSSSQSFVTPTCKKWRCNMNGYIPIWKSGASSFCTSDYMKLSIQNKAYCQDQFCEKVCQQF